MGKARKKLMIASIGTRRNKNNNLLKGEVNMKFTIIFKSEEDSDYSYGLCFTPCPVWTKGDEWILNLHPQNPQYKLGDVKDLIQKEALVEKIKKECLIIVHDIGYGTFDDLKTLQQDLIKEGFIVRICSF